jgi:hypothetical protein
LTKYAQVAFIRSFTEFFLFKKIAGPVPKKKERTIADNMRPYHSDHEWTR